MTDSVVLPALRDSQIQRNMSAHNSGKLTPVAKIKNTPYITYIMAIVGSETIDDLSQPLSLHL